MTDLTGLIDQIPIADIAKKLGIDESVAKTAVELAVPAIVGGMAANAKSGGAESLQSALNNHAGKSTKLADVDEAEGKKIVKNVFGGNTDDVVAAVAKKAKGDAGGGIDIGAIVQQVLPIIAPIVLAYLANQFANGGKTEKATPKAEESKGGDLGSVLGGLLGSQQGQDIVGGLLGGLLGGGKK